MSKRISGMSFDFYINGALVHAETVTDITDNTAAAPLTVYRMGMLMVMFRQRVKLN
jgi:hypothetical protein